MVSVYNDGFNVFSNPAFISQSKKEKNLGLGIFIAINLIENVGGKISFQNNNISNGSIVKIQLNRNI